MMSPRPGLIPGTWRRSPIGSAASVETSSSRRLGDDHEPLDADVDAAHRAERGALRGGSEVAHRAAGADEPPAARTQPVDVLQRLAHMGANPLQILAPRRA